MLLCAWLSPCAWFCLLGTDVTSVGGGAGHVTDHGTRTAHGGWWIGLSRPPSLHYPACRRESLCFSQLAHNALAHTSAHAHVERPRHRNTGAKMVMDGYTNGDRVDEMRVGHVQQVGHGAVRSERSWWFIDAKKVSDSAKSFRCSYFWSCICLIECTSVIMVLVP